LWAETIAALREVLARRPTPKSAAHDGLVFITPHGLPWVKFACEPKGDGVLKVKSEDALNKAMANLLRRLNLSRRGVNFYALRHTFETIGGESCDQVAVDHIMGHADPSMAAIYRERISDDRLRAVVNHVRDWLFRGAESTAPEAAAEEE
jgi:integrase